MKKNARAALATRSTLTPEQKKELQARIRKQRKAVRDALKSRSVYTNERLFLFDLPLEDRISERARKKLLAERDARAVKRKQARPPKIVAVRVDAPSPKPRKLVKQRAFRAKEWRALGYAYGSRGLDPDQKWFDKSRFWFDFEQEQYVALIYCRDREIRRVSASLIQEDWQDAIDTLADRIWSVRRPYELPILPRRP